MIPRTLSRLTKDTCGSAIVEFGILAPVILTLLLGVLQAGLWMEYYNALRSAAADTSRYVTVEYQKSNRISNVDMALWARNHAISAYLLTPSDLSTDVTDAADQPVSGVTEKTLTFTYTMDTVLGVAGIASVPVTFSRPVFVSTT